MHTVLTGVSPPTSCSDESGNDSPTLGGEGSSGNTVEQPSLATDSCSTELVVEAMSTDKEKAKEGESETSEDIAKQVNLLMSQC